MTMKACSFETKKNQRKNLENILQTILTLKTKKSINESKFKHKNKKKVCSFKAKKIIKNYSKENKGEGLKLDG